MAETLGSLIDKLTIKRIRLSRLEQTEESPKVKQAKQIVKEQIGNLSLEIDGFLKKALSGRVILREEKVKLYKNPPSPLKIKSMKKMGALVDLLMRINASVWSLEDQVRAKGCSHKKRSMFKNAIDRENQNRNDCIDRIDELLEKLLKRCRK